MDEEGSVSRDESMEDLGEESWLVRRIMSCMLA